MLSAPGQSNRIAVEGNVWRRVDDRNGIRARSAASMPRATHGVRDVGRARGADPTIADAETSSARHAAHTARCPSTTERWASGRPPSTIPDSSSADRCAFIGATSPPRIEATGVCSIHECHGQRGQILREPRWPTLRESGSRRLERRDWRAAHGLPRRGDDRRERRSVSASHERSRERTIRPRIGA